MANYATLKAAIQQVVKTNGNNEITGALLQQSLLAMINSLGGYYQFAGIATPTTNPGTPDQNVYYIASTAGTYTNFGGLVLTNGEIAILKYNGTWSKDSTGAASLEMVNQLSKKVTGLDSYSFTASTGEHTRFMDMHPIEYVAGTTLKGRISLGTAAFDGSALALFLTAADGTTVVRNIDITMGQEFEVVAGNDASFISFYIWRITTAGTFLVNLQYGGMQEQIENIQESIEELEDDFDAKIDAQNEEISDVESLVYSGFNNGAYAIGGTEIPGVETIDNCLLLWNSGKPYELIDPAWKVKKYPVTPGTNYHIIGSTQYGNAIFSVINSSDTVLYKEKGATSGQEIIDKIYRTPEGAAYIYVAYVTTIKNGILTNVEIAPIEEPEPPGKWAGKKWAAIGDSLTEINSRATKNYLGYISENTGITVVNMGVSGSGYMHRHDLNQAFYQRAANVPTDADVVTIFGSGNDLSGDEYVLGDPTDTGTTTICGCVNTTIETILSVFMAANKVPVIGVITPTPWIGAEPSNLNSRMYAYSAAIIECCRRKSIPVLDLYHESNLHPDNATFRSLAYSRDDGSGVHPDERGHQIIAPMIEKFLSGLVL